MMSTPWFIFKGDYHLGPFTTDEILRKINAGVLTPEQLLWREGEDNWKAAIYFDELFPKAYDEIEDDIENEIEHASEIENENENDHENEEVPELPPLPDLPELSPDAKEDNIFDALPPLPEVEKDEIDNFFIQEERQYVKRESYSRPFLNVKELKNLKQENLKPLQRPSRFESYKVNLAIFFIFLSATIGAGYFGYKTFYFRPVHYDGLSLGQVERLVRFSKKQVDAHKMEVSFDLTSSQNSLWVTTNPPINSYAILSLTSVKGEVIANDEIYEDQILALSETHIMGGRGKFDVFRILKGDRLLTGKYILKLVLMEGPFKNFGIEKDAKWSEILKWSEGEGQTTIQASFLWGLMSQKDFTQTLEKIKAQKQNREQNTEYLKISDRLEKYKTLKILAQNIFTLYKKNIENMKTPHEIKEFEQSYVSEIGPLLQGIIIESINNSNELEKDAKENEAYKKLADYGKNIGGMASDMMTRTMKAKKFDQTAKSRLLNLFEARLETLKENGQRAVNYLEKQLERNIQ